MSGLTAHRGAESSSHDSRPMLSALVKTGSEVPWIVLQALKCSESFINRWHFMDIINAWYHTFKKAHLLSNSQLLKMQRINLDLI